MKIHSALRTAVLLCAIGAAPFAWSADFVKSADIVSALTMVPKAVQGADGRWLQRDPSIDLQVQFDFNKGSLTTTGEQQLDELANAFKQPALAGFAFEVAGHTDKAGTAAYNQKLSMERATSTRDYLVKKHAIAAERIVARGYGFDKLADPSQPTAAINRRVEIRRLPALAMQGQTVQQLPAMQPIQGAQQIMQPMQPMQPAMAPTMNLPQAPAGGVIIQRPQ